MNEVAVVAAKLRSLRPGDVVRVKSGGPPMTVSFVDPDYMKVECGWFWRSTHMRAEFHYAELTCIEGDAYYQAEGVAGWRGTAHLQGEEQSADSPKE